MSTGVTSAPAHPAFATSQPPLIRWVSHDYTNDDVREMFAAYHKWLVDDVTQPFGLVMVVHKLPSAAQRKIIVEFEDRYKPIERRFSCGQTFVCESLAIRALATAIYWMSPPVYPYRCFQSQSQAEAWVRSDLALGLAAFPHGEYWRARFQKSDATSGAS